MTKWIRTELVLCAMVCITACSKDAPQPQQAAAPAAADTRGATVEQDSMRDWFIETSLTTIPGTEAELIGAFGDADSIVRLPSASQQDPTAYDTIIEAHFPGLAVTILKVGQNETLQAIWVGDTTYVSGPIRIGTDAMTLQRLLGPPMFGGEKPGYVCGMCSFAKESVRFELLDGRVTGMLFTFPGS